MVPYYFAPTRTLAVLPFEYLSGDTSTAWLRGGMAEALVSRLGRVPNLVLLEQARVRALLSVGSPSGPGRASEAYLAAAREAGVDLLLQGAFQRLGSRVRITARLVRTRDGKIRAVSEATGELEQAFSLQDRLGSAMDRALRGGLSSPSGSHRARARSSLFVLQLLGSAHAALLEAEKSGSLGKAETLYRQVIQEAADLPEAHHGLAMALWPRRDGRGGKINGEIKAQLKQAIKLRPGYYEALSSLGFLLWSEQRYEQAFALQQRALRLKPTYAMGYYGLGLGHATRGNGEVALTLLRQAVELRPGEAEFHTQLGICVAAFQRDYPKALEHTARAMKLPGTLLWNHVFHAFMQLMTGDPRGCLQTLEVAPADGAYNVPHLGQSMVVKVACLARNGETARARKLAASLPAQARAMLSERPPPGLPAYLKLLLKDLRTELRPITPGSRSGGGG